MFTQAVKLDALIAESVDFGLVAYDRNGILLDYNEVYDVKVRMWAFKSFFNGIIGS